MLVFGPPSKAKQSGMTLIELMIGLVVGLVVIGGALTLLLTSLNNQKSHNQVVRLNQDMRAIMDLMVRDIRRAGFATDNPASNASSLLANPFFVHTGASTTDLSIINTSTDSLTVLDGTGNCILYAYNRDYAGEVPPAVANNERFGFLKEGDDVYIRVSGASNSVSECDTSVASSEWYLMNSSVIEFINLEFEVSSDLYNATTASTASGSCVDDDSCLIVRTVKVDMTARVEDEPALLQTLTETVRIRNDKFVASYASSSIN
jgi:type IV pilus assembly protein PilW